MQSSRLENMQQRVRKRGNTEKVDSPSAANQKTRFFLKTPDYQNKYLRNQPQI